MLAEFSKSSFAAETARINESFGVMYFATSSRILSGVSTGWPAFGTLEIFCYRQHNRLINFNSNFDYLGQSRKIDYG